MMADFNNDQSRGEAEVQRSDHTLINLQHDYKIIREIGRGSFGIVYKALDEVTNELVAIKEADQARKAGDLIAEADILSNLWHDNIVNMKDICGSPSPPHSPDNPALVLELGSCDLWEIMANHSDKLEYQHVKSITQQFFQGLNYIHSEKIIHRDIKPENVMLTDCGTVKITDFGLACTYEPGKCLKPHVGTTIFHSPELLLGATRYSFAVDMWAAGLTVFELFFGNSLFPKRTFKGGMLEDMVHLLGTIDRTTMTDSSDLPDLNFYNLPRNDYNRLEDELAKCTSDRTAIQLFCGILRLNPDTRLSANSALSEPFFSHDPVPEMFLVRDIQGSSASHTQSPASPTQSPASPTHHVSVDAPASPSNTVSSVSSDAYTDDHVSDNTGSVDDDVETSSSQSNPDSSVSSSAFCEDVSDIVDDNDQTSSSQSNPDSSVSSSAFCDDVSDIVDDNVQTSSPQSNTVSFASSDDHVPDLDVINEVTVQTSPLSHPVSPSFRPAFRDDHEVHQVSSTGETGPNVIVEQLRPDPDHVMPPAAFSDVVVSDGVNSMASSTIESPQQLQNIPPEPHSAISVVVSNRCHQRRCPRARPLAPHNRRYHPYFAPN